MSVSLPSSPNNTSLPETAVENVVARPAAEGIVVRQEFPSIRSDAGVLGRLSSVSTDPDVVIPSLPP